MTRPEPLHQGPIRACAFIGAARLATASLEGRIRLWDWAAGELTGVFDAHAGPVGGLVWDAGRERLLSCGHDGLILIHDLGGVRHGCLAGHVGGVQAIAISPDGALVASGGYDRTIRLWRLADGAEVGKLEGHEGAVTSLDYLDDVRLVSGGRDDMVRFWDLAAMRQTATGRGHRRWVTEVRALGADAAVSVSEDGTFRGWSATTGAERWRHAHQGLNPIWGLGVSADGRAAILGIGGEAQGCELGPEGVERTQTLSGLTARAIAVRGDLFALGGDTIGVVMFRGWRQLSVLETRAAGGLSLAARREAVLIGLSDGRVELADSAGRRALAGHAAFTYAAERLGADRFFTGGFDGRARIWGSDGAHARALDHGAFVFSLSASADASRLLVAGGARYSLWDLAEGRLLWRHETARHGFHNFGALSVDGRTVYAVGEGTTLSVLRLSDDGARTEAESRLETGVRLVTALKLLPTPGEALIGTADGQVLRLDLATGATRLLHAANEAWVRELQVSDDGRLVLSVSEMSVAALYDLAEGRLVTPPAFVGRPIPAAAFTPEGDLVWVDGLGELGRLDAAELSNA